MDGQPSSDGRSTRWDDHRATRRAELVRAASRAVHHNGPGVSMDEIATAAGTSKSIIYRYFDDRTGLQVAVGSALVGQMHDALTRAARTAETPRGALRAMVRVYLETIENSPNVYYFVTRTSAVVGTGEADAPGRSDPSGRTVAGQATSGRPATPGGPDRPDALRASDGQAPLAAFIDSVIELVAEPFARIPDVPAADAAAWAAGAVGFVQATGEWWLGRRGLPGVPDRETLSARVAVWLWSGPVGVMSGHDTAAAGVRSSHPPADAPPVPTTASPAQPPFLP